MPTYTKNNQDAMSIQLNALEGATNVSVLTDGTRRSYTPPAIILLSEIMVAGGSSTNVAEISNGIISDGS